MPLLPASLKFTHPAKLLTARIVSTGLNPSTISAQVLSPRNARFHPVLRKSVGLKPRKVMVHDPQGVCVEGDVVRLKSGVYKGLGTGGKDRKGVRFVVESVLVPFARPWEGITEGGNRLRD